MRSLIRLVELLSQSVRASTRREVFRLRGFYSILSFVIGCDSFEDARRETCGFIKLDLMEQGADLMAHEW